MGTDPAAPSVQVGRRRRRRRDPATAISTPCPQVATNLEVRAELLRRQRDIIADCSTAGSGVVAEGRDITTVVAPDADVRILLPASEEARLARRAKELHGEAHAEAVDATRDQIVRRDRDDSSVSQFMQAAPGVDTVDTSDLDLEQSVQAVLDVVAHAHRAGPRLTRTSPGSTARRPARTRHHRKCETMDVDPAPPPTCRRTLP